MSPRGQTQSQKVWFPTVFLPPSPSFFFFPFFSHCLWGLSSPTSDLTQAPAVEAQSPGQPNHWTARKVPAVFVSNDLPLMVINIHTEGLWGPL